MRTYPPISGTLPISTARGLRATIDSGFPIKRMPQHAEWDSPPLPVGCNLPPQAAQRADQPRRVAAIWAVAHSFRRNGGTKLLFVVDDEGLEPPTSSV